MAYIGSDAHTPRTSEAPMAARFLCLQGHLWAYQDDARARNVDDLHCPTCGLRLYSEHQASTIPVRSEHFFPDNPTPMSTADMIRLSRSSGDIADAPAIQPGDIE